jgi:hypothetical protein
MSSPANLLGPVSDAFGYLFRVFSDISKASNHAEDRDVLEQIETDLRKLKGDVFQFFGSVQAREVEEQRKAKEAEEQRKARVAMLEGEVVAKRQAVNILLKRAAALQNLISGAEGDELHSLQALSDASEKKIDDATSALAKAEEELAAVQAAAPVPVPSAQSAAVQQQAPLVQAYPAAPDARPTVVAQIVSSGGSSTEQTPSSATNKRKESPTAVVQVVDTGDSSTAQTPSSQTKKRKVTANANTCVRIWIPAIVKCLKGMNTDAANCVGEWLSGESGNINRLVGHMRRACPATRGKNQGKPTIPRMKEGKARNYLRSQVERALKTLYSTHAGESDNTKSDLDTALIPAIKEVEAVFLAEEGHRKKPNRASAEADKSDTRANKDKINQDMDCDSADTDGSCSERDDESDSGDESDSDIIQLNGGASHASDDESDTRMFRPKRSTGPCVTSGDV